MTMHRYRVCLSIAARLQWFREGEEKQNERDYRLLTARAPRPSEAGIAPDVAHFIEKLRVRVRVCFGFGAHLL